MPEQDIESLGVMGWGWGGVGKFFRRCRRRRRRRRPPEWVFLLENGFFTIGPQNRDLGALLPGNDSYGCPASFLPS